MSAANPPHDPHEDAWAGVNEVTMMAAPIILGTLSWTFMQFVDVYMVGMLGEQPLAAIGNAGIWSYTLITFIVGLCACVSTFVSQSLSRGQTIDCARYTWQGLYLSLAGGIVALTLWPLSEPMFRLMGHSDQVAHYESQYFTIRLWGYAFVGGQVALASFFQAIGRPIIPTAVSIFAILLNALLDYALIFGKFGFPRMEIAGAAIATVLALALQTALLLALFLGRTMNETYATRHAFQPDLRRMRELFRIGWAAGVTMLLDILVWALFTGFIVGRFGDVPLAAQTVVITLMHFSFMPAVGVNHAITPIVGKWIGANNIPRAKARTYTAMRLCIGYMVVVGIAFAVFGPQLLGLFTREPEVIAVGHKMLILCAVFQAFDAVAIATSGALRGAGDTHWMAIVTALAAYGGFLPVAAIIAFGFGQGAVGAWFGATLYIVALSGVFLHRFHGEAWRHIRIFEADRQRPH